MKKIKVCVCACAIILVLYNIFCYIDTKEVINSFNSTLKSQEAAFPAFQRYVGNCKGNSHIEKTYSKVQALYVIHSLKKGIMYVKYTYQHFDKNGEDIGGSYNAPSKWYIEKKNGNWEVVKVEERP